MLRILLIIVLVVVPAVEIFGLIMAGRLIGGWQTFLLILLTGFLGAYLARREGTKVWTALRDQWSIGQIPAVPILHGILIFSGGILLLTPGFFTDLAGFILVIPYTRKYVSDALAFLIKKYFQGKGLFR